ncbi:hypothetical protein ABZP36_012616 [Zizania latifolia]
MLLLLAVVKRERPGSGGLAFRGHSSWTTSGMAGRRFWQSEASSNSRFVLLLDLPLAAAAHSEEPFSAAGTARPPPVAAAACAACCCVRQRPRWRRGSCERSSEASDEAHAAVPPELG